MLGYLRFDGQESSSMSAICFRLLRCLFILLLTLCLSKRMLMDGPHILCTFFLLALAEVDVTTDAKNVEMGS
jgi:hypothetical protein